VIIKPKTFEIECTGYSVKADWYETKNTDEIILSLIGWTSNRKKYNDILSAICTKTGKSALVFDYSGHGDSPFDVSTTRPAQHFLEVICVFDWIKEKYPNAQITVMGTSYGGFLATQLTKYRTFQNLVLRVPAIYKPSDFYTLNGDINSDEGWAAKDAFRRDVEALSKHPLLARVSNFKGKALIVVHENDEQVPKETTDAFTNAFNADVHIAKGFPHSIYNQPTEKVAEYQSAISDWLNKETK
jgi:alpha-beta hydrolase superfamily lysophospholipase